MIIREDHCYDRKTCNKDKKSIYPGGTGVVYAGTRGTTNGINFTSGSKE